MANSSPSRDVSNSNDAAKRPLIPETFIDAPSQRLYAISIALLCQSIKIFDWLHSLVTDRSTNLTLKWMLADAAFCLALKKLRIPRLKYAAAAVILQIVSLCLIDGLLFGSIQFGVASYSLSSSARNFYRKELSTSGRMIYLRDLFSGDSHLRGEHTVRMSPISTVRMNPVGFSYCLAPPSNTVLIPVLLNNTQPSHIRYSISNVGSRKVEYVDLYAKDLRNIEQQRLQAVQVSGASMSSELEESSDVDWDEEDEDNEKIHRLTGLPQDLEKTQSVVHLKVTKPGIIKLERVVDAATNNMARIYPVEIPVVQCPRAEFLSDKISSGNARRCVGSKEELAVRVFGVSPFSLNWHRVINGRREYFSIERIEGVSEKSGLVHELIVPFDMPLNTVGVHSYLLDSLSDGLGNIRSLSVARITDGDAHLSNEITRSVTVLKRAAVSFKDCAPGKPASLLVGSEAPMTIFAREFDEEDGPWSVAVQYNPSPNESSDKKAPKSWTKTFVMPVGKAQVAFTANAPGEYTIVGVKGECCDGDVLSPETCRVIQQPLPTAEIEWKRIHECSGDTGVSAIIILHGQPPFEVTIQQRRNNEPYKEMTRIFHGSRGEITLQPESSGNYSYTFTRMSDANYKNINLDGPTITQVVHPLAHGNFVIGGSIIGSKRVINSCSGSTVDVDVDLRGDGPWNVQIQTVGPKGSEILHMRNLRKSRERLGIPIPRDIDRDGGAFHVDLVSIEDSYGCKKELSVPGITVNVRRALANARFYTKDQKREITVLENHEARLPLRLTGEGPWKIRYTLVNSTRPPQSAILNHPNDYLIVHEKGSYHLVEVSDSQCPGTVVELEADYKVDWTPRPVVRLSPETEMRYEKSNGSFIRSPICEKRDDFVDLMLEGRPPFQIAYNVARKNDAGGTRIIDQPIKSSIQSKTRIQLLTAQAGRIFYEVRQVGDSNYPIEQNRQHVIPRYERLLFEQEVIGRPSAYFKNPGRLTHCLRDNFVPKDANFGDDTVVLEGKPPFYLELSVKDLAASEVHYQTVELRETEWRISLPNYVFSSIGPHLVTIESIRDSSSCPQATPDPFKSSIWVDVAESAAIVPFDRREHFCVGDVTQFQLEGIPPWSIGYRLNRKHHEQVVKQSPFSLVQQHPGEFAITFVSHQQQMCKTTVDNIKFQVHALPSAQVASGREVFENIHEGSQAQITFTLVGEPPFTFTYQRSEPPSRKGGRPGKVLETHTVSGVMSHEYSIYSALEGTWTVTFISDKYCRYPPATPESLQEKMNA